MANVHLGVLVTCCGQLSAYCLTHHPCCTNLMQIQAQQRKAEQVQSAGVSKRGGARVLPPIPWVTYTGWSARGSTEVLATRHPDAAGTLWLCCLQELMFPFAQLSRCHPRRCSWVGWHGWQTNAASQQERGSISRLSQDLIGKYYSWGCPAAERGFQECGLAAQVKKRCHPPANLVYQKRRVGRALLGASARRYCRSGHIHSHARTARSRGAGNCGAVVHSLAPPSSSPCCILPAASIPALFLLALTRSTRLCRPPW